MVTSTNEVLSAYPMRKLSNRESPCSSLPARAFFNVPLRSSSFITETVISGFLSLVHVYKTIQYTCILSEIIPHFFKCFFVHEECCSASNIQDSYSTLYISATQERSTCHCFILQLAKGKMIIIPTDLTLLLML